MNNNCKQQITAEQKKMTPKEAAIKDYQSGAFPAVAPSNFTHEQKVTYYNETIKLVEAEDAREVEELRAGI